MIVTHENFDEVVKILQETKEMSLDTETTGLRPFHGDRLFSIIIGTENESYYFNFQAYADTPSTYHLTNRHLQRIGNEVLLQKNGSGRRFYLHNAKFDLHFLRANCLELEGEIHCTEAVARVEYNEHLKYSLDACSSRIGLHKSDAVEAYIMEHGLWKWADIPGKKTRKKDKFFSKVPFDIIAPYGEQDGRVTYSLARHQEKAIQEIDQSLPPKRPKLSSIVANEKRITKVCFEMESLGVKIDKEYCLKAVSYEESRQAKATKAFFDISGISFKDSNAVLAKAFTAAGENFPRTEKGNPSFVQEVLKSFSSPLAKTVLDFRDAKSRSNFFNGFLYFSDSDSVIHPNMRQAGTNSGRFSYSDPNLQNLTKESEDSPKDNSEFPVRRALVPRPGFIWVSMDFDQLEYRLMLDYSGEKELIDKVKAGLDVHEATSEMIRRSRTDAKKINFGLLYGEGEEKLGNELGVSRLEARQIKKDYFSRLPRVSSFIQTVIYTAKTRGHIFNKFGRMYYFDDSNFAYKAPNRLIQGTAGDLVKIAMVRIYDFLLPYKSNMILNVHDELDFEIHETELFLVPLIKEIIESVYPYETLPLTTSISFSHRSFGDLEDWIPNGPEKGNGIPKTSS